MERSAPPAVAPVLARIALHEGATLLDHEVERRPSVLDPRAGASSVALPVVAALFWLIVAGLILSHRVFASNDSLSTYAHVWYAAESLWQRHVLPLHMPALNGGEGLAFPYGAPAWLLAGLLWPALGEWGVTLLLVLGGAAVTAAACSWRPALRHPFLLALFVLNPFAIEAVVLAQYPFLWATTCFFLGAAALERRRDAFATVWLALALFTHPAIMALPVTALAVFHARQPWRWPRVALVYGVALLAAAPAFALTLATPALTDNSRLDVLTNYVYTLLPRLTVLAAPVALAYARRLLLARRTQVSAMVLLVSPAVLLAHHDLWAFKQLARQPSEEVAGAILDASFEPGAVYRVLDAADGKVSMYRVIRAGGVLDGDFFPESLVRQDWPSDSAYREFLSGRRVRYVLITRAFDRDFHTNEHTTLRDMALAGAAAMVYHDERVEVYRVDRTPNLLP